MNLDDATGATVRAIICAGCGRVAVADMFVDAGLELRHWDRDPLNVLRNIRVGIKQNWGRVDDIATLIPGGARTQSGTAPTNSVGQPIHYCPACLPQACATVDNR